MWRSFRRSRSSSPYSHSICSVTGCATRSTRGSSGGEYACRPREGGDPASLRRTSLDSRIRGNDPMTSGPTIGILAHGPRGTIADVGGVTVGHCTIAEGDLQTGVTVIRPHPGDPFRAKVPAAAVVINGFGKSVGILQVNELGVLETPIALTNTFSVGTVATAQIRAATAAHPGIARTTTSVNPLVFECSDAFLSDMQAPSATETHYGEALAAAGAEFARGSVGAGRGM